MKTVSNVVNGYVHVSTTTRDRVDRAIADLDYRPNLAAQPAPRPLGIVALAVPDLDVPYFAELAVHVVRAARTQGWTVLIDQTDGDRDREARVLDNFGTHLVDGVLLSPVATGAGELRRPAGPRRPWCSLGTGRTRTGRPRVHRQRRGGRDRRRPPDGLGRRRVAVSGDPGVGGDRRLRLRLPEALSHGRAAARPGASWSTPSFTRAGGGRQRACSAGAAGRGVLLQRPARARRLRRCPRRARRVPDDMAVIRFDDIEDGRWTIHRL